MILKNLENNLQVFFYVKLFKKIQKIFIKTLDLCVTISYNIITVKEDLSEYAREQERKGEKMEEGMTNEQFKIVLKMIIQILKDDGVKEETIKKIEDLLK